MSIPIPPTTTKVTAIINRTAGNATNFKNLEQRYLEKMNEIYGRYSTTDKQGGEHGVAPFIETKPNNPILPDYTRPSREMPIQAIGADVTRLGKFIINNPWWVLDQQNLQSGNTFTETRVVNPLFITLIGNAQPFVHIKRPLADAINSELGGDGPHPGSPNNIGAAGRLQKATSKKAVNLLLTGGRGSIWSSLARIAPPNRVFNTISMTANVIGDIGPLEIGQRPEMDMDGTGRFNSLYSIKSWLSEGYNGFMRTDTPTNTLARVGANLRTGNIAGARAALTSGLRETGQSIRSGINDIGNLLGRGTQSLPGVPEADNTNRAQRGLPGYKFEGKRYFITSMGIEGAGELPADRYMRSSVYSTDGKISAFLNLGGPILVGSDPNPAEVRMLFPALSLHQQYNTDGTLSTIQRSLDANHGIWSTTPIVNRPTLLFTEPIITLEDLRTRTVVTTADVSRQDRDSNNSARRAITQGPVAARNVLQSQASQAIGRNTQIRLADAAVNNSIAGGSVNLNPAEAKMISPESALRQQYSTDSRLNAIQASLDNQQSVWLTTLSNARINQNRKGGGFGGGVSVNGEVISITQGAKNPFTVATDEGGRRKYFFDNINKYPATRDARRNYNITKESMDAMKEVHGTPLVDFYLYDFVNRVAIPFRATIVSLNESTNPEFSDNFYIGRTERNIIYTGVRRELSLSFMIYAFNEEELAGIWSKLNYLTSLCFPADYNNGFMVPPLIKLTLGDVYNNQPGYIKSLNYNVDSDTPWEIEEPLQVPHGVTVSMGYSIIEKVAQYSGKYAGYNPLSPPRYFVPLYNYGNPRLSQPPSPPPRRRTRVEEQCPVVVTPRTRTPVRTRVPAPQAVAEGFNGFTPTGTPDVFQSQFLNTARRGNNTSTAVPAWIVQP